MSRLEIYLRLNALPWLFADDVVLPMQEKGGTHVHCFNTKTMEHAENVMQLVCRPTHVSSS